MPGSRLPAAVLAGLVLAHASTARATTWHVALGGTGTGTSAAPFGRIQDGIDAAQPGDVVRIAPGTYAERLRTVRAGTDGARITVRADGTRGSVVVTASGRVLTVGHANVTVDGLVLDGAYGADDIVRVLTPASGFVLRNAEVRRTSRDAIDVGGAHDVLIEASLVHHALNAAGGRTDAHGIVAGAVRRLTIRDTEIHTFSGDAIQVDPGRSAPGWNDVRIDGCRLWLAPLPAAENGFAAGTVPGENAVDTKASASLSRATIAIHDTVAWGFRGGLIANMAAFNLKEHIDAVVDRVTVWDSEIAFRLRGDRGATRGARVRVQNAVVYHAGIAFRYEDDIRNLRVWHVTIGAGVPHSFRAASSSSIPDVRNLLVLGSGLPREASGKSNLAVPASAFVDVGAANYRLTSASPAIDAGSPLEGVAGDRDGAVRPQGRGVDVGAYEGPAGVGGRRRVRMPADGRLAVPRQVPNFFLPHK